MKTFALSIFLIMTSAAQARHDFWEFAPKQETQNSQQQQQPAPTPAPSESGWNWNSLKARVVTKVNQWMGWQTPPNNPAAQATASLPAPTEAAQNPTQINNTVATNPVSERVPSRVVPKMQFQEAAKDIKRIEIARIVTPATKSQDKNLKYDKKSNIPVFDFKKWTFLQKTKGKKVAKVPLLDVGKEAILDPESFEVVSIESLPTVPDERAEALPSPDIASAKEFKNLLDQKFDKVTPVVKIEIPALKASEKVSRERIDKTVYTVLQDVPVTPLPVTEFTAEQLKLVKGLIVFEKADQCHVASGIFSDLVDSKDKRISEKSRYHLGYCLVEMSLPLEATHHLGIVIRSQNPDYTSPSLKRIVEDVPVYLETQVAEAILSADENMIPKESRDKANYVKAKYFMKKDQPRRALEHAEKVSKESDKYYKSQYVASVAEYASKNLDGSIARQKTLIEELKKRNSDKEVLALVQLNLGRMNFQKGKYVESLKHFQQVPKEHPLWLQGLTEQAWAQLQAKDAPGAIGNMHSIHSPYFKNVYKPESYIVRSIGYLNICQYGDAHKSLAYLEGQYGLWLSQMEPYDKKADGKMMYDTVIKYLQGKPSVDVDGVPYQALREIARQRDFLNTQDAVNNLIDEGGAYGFLKNLIQKDKRALSIRRAESIKRIADLNFKIKNSDKTPGAAKNLNTWKYELANNKDFLSVYDFKLSTMIEGEKGLMRLSEKSQARLNQMKSNMKALAGKTLKSHFSRMVKELKQNFENNELLKYEIYAGSGENLRYKIAGGKTGGPSKMNANREPAGNKWDFDGEYWEDEIGNYRSSLKNNCQSNAR